MNTWEFYEVEPSLGMCRWLSDADDGSIVCGQPNEWAGLDAGGWLLGCREHFERKSFKQRVNVAELVIVGMSRAHDWELSHR